MSKVLRGKDLIVKINEGSNYSAIALATGCKISLTSSTVDSQTKDDPEDWEVQDIITKGWSISSEQFVSPTESGNDAASLAGMIHAWMDSTDVEIEVTIGGMKFTGKAKVSQVDLDGTVKQNATASATLAGNGALAIADAA